MTNGTYFSTAVFQQDVDVLLVFKMVIKVHNVLMVQYSMQLDFSVDLAGKETTVTIVTEGKCCDICCPVIRVRTGTGAARLPSPVGGVWRRAHVG